MTPIEKLKTIDWREPAKLSTNEYDKLNNGEIALIAAISSILKDDEDGQLLEDGTYPILTEEQRDNLIQALSWYDWDIE